MSEYATGFRFDYWSLVTLWPGTDVTALHPRLQPDVSNREPSLPLTPAGDAMVRRTHRGLQETLLRRAVVSTSSMYRLLVGGDWCRIKKYNGLRFHWIEIQDTLNRPGCVSHTNRGVWNHWAVTEIKLIHGHARCPVRFLYQIPVAERSR